ncbi:MAG: hypothetical protein ACLP5H_10260 [Desulfomonilaceae bacterium]
MYSYIAYGLGIRCDIPLPGLIEQEAAGDVVMRLGKPKPLLEPVSPNIRLCLQFKANEAYFYYHKMGRCRVSHGREIIGEPVPGSDEKRLGGLAQTLGLSILLHQRGYVTLHASCVNLGPGAVAFLGDSTAGKSFIAAALHSRSHAVVADDVTVVDVEGSSCSVYPGLPVLQLLPDAAKHFNCFVEESEGLDPFEEKVTWRVPGEFPQYAVPLRRLYILEDGPSVRIERLSRHKAVFELVRHSYWVRLMHDARPASYFLQCARLCEKVPVLRLIRPRSASTMSEVLDMVEQGLWQDASGSERLRKP